MPLTSNLKRITNDPDFSIPVLIETMSNLSQTSRILDKNKDKKK